MSLTEAGLQPARSQVHEEDQDFRRAPDPLRSHSTILQRLGGLLLAAVGLVGVLVYVPRIVADDSSTFTGTVTSSGVTDLNFGSSGRVAQISVRLGQAVKAGQVLATETDRAATAVVGADQAAITADKANIAGLRAEEAAATNVTPATRAAAKAQLAEADAQLAKDEANLASDKLKLLATRIVAPAGGTVVAVNGQVGETVSADGIRTYSSQPQQAATQQPAFSLLPEGPRSSVRSGSPQADVPVIALRTSGAWQVLVLVPENTASEVTVGEDVVISVPAAHLSDVHGHIQELSPTPVTTSSGIAYQAVVNVLTPERVTPLTGMAANAQLGS